MVWELLTRACGHDERLQIYGSWRHREGRLAWLRQQPCASCRKEQYATDMRAASAGVRAQADALGWELPAMDGTEKQAHWATDLRAQALVRLDRLIQHRFDVTHRISLEAWLFEETSRWTEPSFWIDHRDDLDTTLLSLAICRQIHENTDLTPIWKRDRVRRLAVHGVPLQAVDWIEPGRWARSRIAQLLGKDDARRVGAALKAFWRQVKDEEQRRDAEPGPEGREALRRAHDLLTCARHLQQTGGETAEGALERALERNPEDRIGEAWARRLLAQTKSLLDARSEANRLLCEE